MANKRIDQHDTITPDGSEFLLTQDSTTLEYNKATISSVAALAQDGFATVATTGAYSDLTGTPTLGTAAATSSTDYATAAQGTKADTAVQPATLTASLSTKQDTLVSGTNIKTVNGSTLLGSGDIVIAGDTGDSGLVVDSSTPASTDVIWLDTDDTSAGLTKADIGLGNVDNTSDANKPVSTATQTALDGKQNADATLTALAAHNTNGILTQTSADTFTGRTITGTTNQITVTNGDGVSGNPTLSLPQNIHTGASPTFAGATLAGHTAPSTDSTYTLGTSSAYWSNTYTDRLYLNSTAYLDGATAGTVAVTGRLSVPSIGANNQMIGAGVGNATQTGTYNVALGINNFAALTSGSYNMAIGSGALSVNTTGERNTVIGAFAMDANITGSSNLALGQDALGSNTGGNSNVSIGAYSMLSNTAGNENVAIGQSAREKGTGGGNVAIGHEAAKQRTSGNDNVFIGIRAGFSAATGSANVFIGANAGANETGSNKLYIANSNTATPLIGGDFSALTLTTPASIEVTNNAKGIILKSPDGTRYRITMANGGTLNIAVA